MEVKEGGGEGRTEVRIPTSSFDQQPTTNDQQFPSTMNQQPSTIRGIGSLVDIPRWGDTRQEPCATGTEQATSDSFDPQPTTHPQRPGLDKRGKMPYGSLLVVLNARQRMGSLFRAVRMDPWLQDPMAS